MVRRTVVKATLMQTTLHLVAARDYLAYAGVFPEGHVADLQRQLEAMGEDADFEEEAARLATFAAEQPQNRPELLSLLGRPKLRIEERRAVARLVRACRVRGPRQRPVVVGMAWHTPRAERSCPLGPGSAPTGPREPARRLVSCGATSQHLVQRAGLTSRSGRASSTESTVDSGLERLELRRFRDELGRNLYDLPRAPLPPADTPLLHRASSRDGTASCSRTTSAHAHSRRSTGRQIIAKNGDVAETFLVDGFVAGQWSLDMGYRVRLAPFAPLPRGARRQVEDEAARLEAFVRASGKS